MLSGIATLKHERYAIFWRESTELDELIDFSPPVFRRIRYGLGMVRSTPIPLAQVFKLCCSVRDPARVPFMEQARRCVDAVQCRHAEDLDVLLDQSAE